MKRLLKKQTMTIIAAGVMAAALTACGGKTGSNAGGEQPAGNEAQEAQADEANKDEAKSTGSDTDIDLDALNSSVDAIKNLDLGPNGSEGGKSTDNTDTEKPADTAQTDKTESNAADTSYKGEKTVYSYVDVYRDGNDLTLVPNGGMSGSTVLCGGKDLKGFLDYIDSTVLEEGRKVNRDMFYGLLASMLVDKDLSSDTDRMEKHLIRALAIANNFHDVDVKIKDCYIDADNAADYHFNLIAYGKDDTWIINLEKSTLFMNNGKTEYVSDMFKDEYLAVWMMAFDDYYGIN